MSRVAAAVVASLAFLLGPGTIAFAALVAVGSAVPRPPDDERPLAVYTQGGRLYVWPMGSTTAPRRVATSLPPEKSHPFATAKGRRIAFSVGRGRSLYVVSTSGGRATRIGATTPHGGEAWSPDGKRLVYDLDVACFVGRSYMPRLTVARADGTFRRRIPLLPRPEKLLSDIQFFGWSPDSTRLLYAVYTSDDWVEKPECDTRPSARLYVMRADGTRRTLIARGDMTEAKWAPNGRRVAYVSRGRFNSHIQTVGLDGQNRSRFEESAGPWDWSRGGALAYVTCPGGGPAGTHPCQLEIADDRLRARRPLTEQIFDAPDVGCVAWSLQGDEIFVCNWEDDNSENSFGRVIGARVDNGVIRTVLTWEQQEPPVGWAAPLQFSQSGATALLEIDWSPRRFLRFTLDGASVEDIRVPPKGGLSELAVVMR